MKIIKIEDVKLKGLCIVSPKNDFVSNRYLVKSDGMGYSINRTIIPKDNPLHTWHYKNHLESCYCVRGRGIITDIENGTSYEISAGTLYALDKHDKHTFRAIEETELICVFNPPLVGGEVHNNDGVY